MWKKLVGDQKSLNSDSLTCGLPLNKKLGQQVPWYEQAYTAYLNDANLVGI